MFLNYKIAKKCPKKSEICAYRDSDHRDSCLDAPACAEQGTGAQQIGPMYGESENARHDTSGICRNI